MKTIYLAGGQGSNTAIKVITSHLEKAGHRVTRDPKDPNGWDVTVRWGRSYGYDKPALNAHVNQFDKYEAFFPMVKLDVSVPSVFSMQDFVSTLPQYLPVFPWLARKKHHVKGKDIEVIKTYKEAQAIKFAGTHDFFSVWIPTKTEYRVWVFQDQVLAVYEKTFKGEGEYEGFMRNRRFGFKFEKRDDLRGVKSLVKNSVNAVKAVNMDFGAVDVLEGKDGKFYVLEVNSMPHIDSTERSSGIRLAAAMSKWAEAQ